MAEKPRIRVRAGSAPQPGRPHALAGEQMIVGGELLHSFRLADGKNQNGVWFFPIDDILRTKGFSIYRSMKDDDQVKACLSFKKILVAGREFEISPADDSDEAKKIAEFVEWNLRKKIDLKSIFYGALTALDWGFSIGEICWGTDKWQGERRVVVEKIPHRDPEDIEIECDAHGNVLTFRQRSHFLKAKITDLPPTKVYHFAHQSEFGNPYGRSDLRAAYRPWWVKKFLINFWNVFLERMGSPLTKMTYPQGSPDQLKATLKGILTSLGSRSEVLVPEGVEIELIEATRAGHADYDKAIQYCDMAISRAMLVVSLLGMGGDDVKRGSDSQARLHLRVLFKMSAELGDALARRFMDTVVKQLVDMNFAHDNLYPTFNWQDYGEFEGIEVADTIRLLHAAGVIDMDQKDVNYARSVLGLPLRGENDKEDDVRRPPEAPPPGNANAPPPKAGQGNQRAAKGAGGARKTQPGGGASKGA
jgi:phage gp29-like protein